MSKKLIYLILLLATPAWADLNNPTEWTEADGSPSVYDPWRASFSNGSVTNNGDGSISISTGGGGITAFGSPGFIQFISSDGTNLSGDTTLKWYPDSNTLVISRDSGQNVGSSALIISSDTGGKLANISFDGSGYFENIDVRRNISADVVIDLGITGVRIGHDSDGALLLTSRSAGSTENMTINLDDTSNAWVYSSTTSVNTSRITGATMTNNVDSTTNTSLATFAVTTNGDDWDIQAGGSAHATIPNTFRIRNLTDSADLISADASNFAQIGGAITPRVRIQASTTNVGAFVVPSLAVSTDTGVLKANITNDGSAFFQSLQLANPLPIIGGGTGANSYPNATVIYLDGTVFSGDQGMVWNETTNTLIISRDDSQTGEAFIISSDTGALLANVSHDGSAFFQRIQIYDGIVVTADTTTVISGELVVYDGPTAKNKYKKFWTFVGGNEEGLSGNKFENIGNISSGSVGRLSWDTTITCGHLMVMMEQSPDTGNSWTISLFEGETQAEAVATAVSCTVSGAADYACNNMESVHAFSPTTTKYVFWGETGTAPSNGNHGVMFNCWETN